MYRTDGTAAGYVFRYAIDAFAEKKERDGLRKSYMAGADEYLTKNVDEEELVLRIRAVLGDPARIMIRSFR